MKNCIFLIALHILLLALVGLTLPVLGDSREDDLPKSIRVIGTIDGKTYLVDNSTLMNWTDARVFCDDAGMRLATITTPAQAALLYEKKVLFSEQWHWIGARDILTISQFAWDHNGEVMQNPDITFRHRTGLYSCCSYHPYAGTNGTIDGEPCARLYPVLCEILHGLDSFVL